MLLNFSGKNSKGEGKTVLDVPQQSFILICTKLACVKELYVVFLGINCTINNGNTVVLLPLVWQIEIGRNGGNSRTYTWR